MDGHAIKDKSRARVLKILLLKAKYSVIGMICLMIDAIVIQNPLFSMSSPAKLLVWRIIYIKPVIL